MKETQSSEYKSQSYPLNSINAENLYEFDGDYSQTVAGNSNNIIPSYQYPVNQEPYNNELLGYPHQNHDSIQLQHHQQHLQQQQYDMVNSANDRVPYQPGLPSLSGSQTTYNQQLQHHHQAHHLQQTHQYMNMKKSPIHRLTQLIGNSLLPIMAIKDTSQAQTQSTKLSIMQNSSSTHNSTNSINSVDQTDGVASGYVRQYQDLAPQSYPDITSYINSNPNAPAPEVESYFDDQSTCRICGRNNFMNLKRHLKIHEQIPRYNCKFPKSVCNYKTNSYNRSFDFKRHLINKHFKFKDKKIKKLSSLTDKFAYPGECPCGYESTAKDWLSNHILTDNDAKRCTLFKNS